MKLNLFQYLKRKPSLGLLFVIQLIVLMGLGMGSLLVFTELTEEVIYEKSVIVEIDDLILKQIIQGRYQKLDNAMIFITHLGSWQAIVSISSVVFIFLLLKKCFYLAAELTLVTVGSIGFNVILKDFFNRPRPEGTHVVEVISSSYPSGHSMISFAVYGLLIYIVWKTFSNSFFKIIFSLILFSLILLIGFSRAYLKVHYPSDIAGGFIAGLFWLVLCIGIVHISQYFLKRKLIVDDKSKQDN